jgi:hypothetical protein
MWRALARVVDAVVDHRSGRYISVADKDKSAPRFRNGTSVEEVYDEAYDGFAQTAAATVAAADEQSSADWASEQLGSVVYGDVTAVAPVEPEYNTVANQGASRCLCCACLLFTVARLVQGKSENKQWIQRFPPKSERIRHPVLGARWRASSLELLLGIACEAFNGSEAFNPGVEREALDSHLRLWCAPIALVCLFCMAASLV